jgi:hypothetical protein
VNSFDVACLVAASAAAFAGWRVGLLVRLVSSAGAVGGLLLAAANIDAVAVRLPRADSTPRLVGVLAALLIGWVGGRLVGGLVGRWLRNRMPEPIARTDRLLGAGAGVTGVCVAVWLAAPVMRLLPGWPSRSVSESSVVKQLDATVGLAPLPFDGSLWPDVNAGDISSSVSGLPAATTDRVGKALSDSVTEAVTESITDAGSGNGGSGREK